MNARIYKSITAAAAWMAVMGLICQPVLVWGSCGCSSMSARSTSPVAREILTMGQAAVCETSSCCREEPANCGQVATGEEAEAMVEPSRGQGPSHARSTCCAGQTDHGCCSGGSDIGETSGCRSASCDECGAGSCQCGDRCHCSDSDRKHGSEPITPSPGSSLDLTQLLSALTQSLDTAKVAIPCLSKSDYRQPSNQWASLSGKDLCARLSRFRI